MPVCSLPGADIAYRLEGLEDGPALVLSNSLGTDLSMWDPQVAALAPRFRLLRYDTRGHGASSDPPGPYSLGQMAGDLLGLANRLGIERFVFCGLSLGGLLGQELGVRHGDRLTALVLANTAPSLPPRENWDARIAAVSQDGMGAIVDMAMQRFFSASFRARNEPLAVAMRDTFLKTAPRGYAGACAAVRDADFGDELGKIRTPTLVIGGSLDVSTPPAMGAEALTAKIPGAEQVILEAGHISNVEQPAAFNAALLSFLGR